MEAAQGSPPNPIPGEAPPFIWLLVLAAAALWWLWPWLERWQQERQAPPPPSAEERAAAASILAAGIKGEEPESDVEDLLRPDLGFDPLTVFRESYAQACGLMEKVLEVPPLGEQFTAAVTGLHAIGNILDRLFQAWATDDLGRLSQMREDSEGFAKSFGGRDNPLQSLLAHAGFERRDMDGTSGKPGAVWVLDHTNPSLRLRALTVRLCLRRFAELQRLRGTHRWAQSSNAAVVPKPDEASLQELLELYKAPPEGVRPSARERNLEAEVKSRIHERREESGLHLPLVLHEGLSAAARSLAQSQRVREREGKLKPDRLRLHTSEVQEVLGRMPLPPGFSAAQLFFRSTELPRLFGLTSSTGAKGTPMGGGARTDDKDQAADILAREAVGFWAARQSQDLAWSGAALCGIGAALDYTVNRGFVVALLIGYEGLSAEASHGLAERREELAGLRKRQAAAAEAAAQAAPAQSFGARVRTLDAPTADAVLHRK